MSRILGASERAHDTLAPSYRALPIGAYIRIYFPAACTVRPAGFVAQAFLPGILACALSVVGQLWRRAAAALAEDLRLLAATLNKTRRSPQTTRGPVLHVYAFYARADAAQYGIRNCSGHSCNLLGIEAGFAFAA